MSVTNYHTMLCNIPGERRFTLHCSRSQKSYSSVINHKEHRILTEMLTASQLVKKLTEFYRIQHFITMFIAVNYHIQKIHNTSFFFATNTAHIMQTYVFKVYFNIIHIDICLQKSLIHSSSLIKLCFVLSGLCRMSQIPHILKSLLRPS